MANPTVFVSSTFYDLRYPRENLKRFIEGFGYTPVLSENGAVFFDPRTTAAESCLGEVSNANLLVLLIGGRFGSIMPGSDQSVTNSEFHRAVEQKIPVFAMVEQGTYNDYLMYKANSDQPPLLEIMTFPHSDSIKIFEFIDSVQSRAINNALVPFQSVTDIEDYLRLQWAGMMHNYLSSESREARVVDTLTVLSDVNSRIAFIAEQILRVVGSPTDKIYVRLLQALVDSRAASDVRFLGGKPTPGSILLHETYDDCVQSFGITLSIIDGDLSTPMTIASPKLGTSSQARLDWSRERYAELRTKLLEELSASGVSVETIVEYETDFS